MRAKHAVNLQMNMYALDSMAGMERNLGPKLFAAFYLLAGLGGSIASFLFSPIPSLGASGSVFGMFSATWMYFENNKPYLSRGAKAAQQSILQTMMINLLLGTFIARVDNWCACLGPCLNCCMHVVWSDRITPSAARMNARRAEITCFRACRGHAGGFVTGLILAYLFGPRLRPDGFKRRLVNKPRISL